MFALVVFFLGSFVKETAAAKTRNENSACQIFPVNDPLTGIDTTSVPLHTRGQDTHQTAPPLAPTFNTLGRDTYQTPPPPPPNVVYPPIVPYYVLPPDPVSSRITEGGTRLLPHSPVGAPDLLQVSQWLLDLQRNKVGSFPQSSGNPSGKQRGSLLTKRFDSTSSEQSSEEDSDGD